MTISQKMIWNTLFGLTTLLIFWIGGKFFFELFSYLRLTEVTEAYVDSWEIVKKNKGKYGIVARYHFFPIDGEEVFKEHLFQKPSFENVFAAEENVKKWKDAFWPVYFSLKKPTISSLQKLFPFKQCFRFLLALAVMIYFILLHRYLYRLPKEEEPPIHEMSSS